MNKSLNATNYPDIIRIYGTNFTTTYVITGSNGSSPQSISNWVALAICAARDFKFGSRAAGGSPDPSIFHFRLNSTTI